MSNRSALLVVFLLVMVACGGGDDGVETTTTVGAGAASSTVAPGSVVGESAASGEVVDRQAPGAAAARVDAQDLAFDTVGPVGCSVSSGEILVGFILPDNEASFVAGATASGSGWRGRIDLNIQGADGVTNYFADLTARASGSISVDGSSFSYSGEWQVLRPGSVEAESAGDGVLSASCA